MTEPAVATADAPLVKLEEGNQRRRLGDLYESPDNPREITDEAFEDLGRTLREVPGLLEARPLIVLLDGEIIAGNMRHRRLTLDHGPDYEVPIYATDLDREKDRDEIEEWLTLDNQPFGDWDNDRLAQLLARRKERGADLSLLGFRRQTVDELLVRADRGTGRPSIGDLKGPSLADRFGMPPFDVLDGRSGQWRRRKKEWLGLGIKSELGREGASSAISNGDPTGGDPQFYEKKRKAEEELGFTIDTAAFLRDHYKDERGSADTSIAPKSISVFDPVLCELVYRWFSAEGHRVIDPFAGGSVRGIIAAHLGREYTGVDLNHQQTMANEDQLDLVRDDSPRPRWHPGDARNINRPGGVHVEDSDLLFTCPPYWNLEVYSKKENDLSAAPSWEEFARGYEACLSPAVRTLRDNRFAVLVVGELRDPKTGQLRSLRSLTISVMEDLGLTLYNSAVYITQVGSLRIRVGKDFVRSRKLGRTHQHVLVFAKGDPKAAADATGEVDATIIADAVEEATADEDDGDDD